MNRLRLQAKYTLTVAALILVVVVALSATLGLQFRNTTRALGAASADVLASAMEEQLGHRALHTGRMVAGNLTNPVYQLDLERISDLLRITTEQPGVVYAYVYDDTGRFLHDGSEELHRFGQPMEGELGRRAVAAREPMVQHGGKVLEAVVPIALGERHLGGVRIGFALDVLAQEQARLQRQVAAVDDAGQRSERFATLAITGALLLVGFLLAALIARGLVLPVKRLAQEAQRIGRGEAAEIDVERGDELGELADALRGMYQDLTRTTVSIDYLNDIIDSMNEMVVVVNPDTTIRLVNRAAVRLTGYQAGELLGRPVAQLFAPATGTGLPDLLATLPTEPIGQRECILRPRRGREVPVLLSSSPLSSAAHHRGSVLVAQDITERKDAEERVRFHANYDALTQLPNRRLFRDRLEQAMLHQRRDGGMVGLLFMDLDGFKLVNDSLGHTVGDVLLTQMASLIKACVRTSDTVARLGGDEFTAVITMRRVEDAAVVAQKIINALSRPYLLNGHEVFVTASIGIAVFPNDADGADDLIRHADTAMYHAKERGKNNYQFFTEEMNVRALGRLSLENDLRRAVERQEFVLHFQPRVDANDGCITGAEALVRWKHPERGLLYPGEFIQAAEESGLILPIGEQVLRMGCREAVRWSRDGLAPIVVAVNLSARQFRQADLVERIQAVLLETELDPWRLELEITETSTMEHADQTIVKLHALSRAGIRVAIDDFGTGYSSLNYLKKFPIDVLKVDQSFVRDITSDPDDAAIVTATITMAQHLDLEVIAEGVETEEQAAFLREHGCNQLQGYLFSRPQPAEVFAALLRDGIPAAEPTVVKPAARG